MLRAWILNLFNNNFEKTTISILAMLTKPLNTKPIIKLRFQNGLSLESFKREVFDVNNVSNFFAFEESDNPDFIIFGPYGNDIPPVGNYIRIAYFCENITPDFSNCEWAFGVPREKEIGRNNYKRIQWHGVFPQSLIKPENQEIDRIVQSKTCFCNFLYSHKVAYREQFFKELSKYKKVDAPGKSMNNMPSIDSIYKGDIWERKRQFLSPYKFTIAFENYSYPGYQTEKLYDSMAVNSIPIYCGDPFIGDIFNTRSFINAFETLQPNYSSSLQKLEQKVQLSFIDIRPQFYKNLSHRTLRKIKQVGRELKMKIEFNNLNYKALVDRIVEIDENEGMYRNTLAQPWFNNNTAPALDCITDRWTEIFNTKIN